MRSFDAFYEVLSVVDGLDMLSFNATTDFLDYEWAARNTGPPSPLATDIMGLLEDAIFHDDLASPRGGSRYVALASYVLLVPCSTDETATCPPEHGLPRDNDTDGSPTSSSFSRKAAGHGMPAMPTDLRTTATGSGSAASAAGLSRLLRQGQGHRRV